MGIFRNYILPALILFSSLLVFTLFRTVPASKLWNDYTVFYVPLSAPQRTVSQVLSENGIDDYISLENQRIPLNIISKTPEVKLSVSYGNIGSEYLSERKNYFFDGEKNFRVYYVPENESENLSRAKETLLEKHGISSGTNAKSSYPFLVPLVSLAFASVLVFFSKRKFFSSLFMVSPLWFSFCVPFYTSAASACLVMYAVFLFLRIWKRRDSLKVIARNPVFASFVFAAFLVSVFSGLKSALLFVFLLCSLVSEAILVSNLEDLLDRKRFPFVPEKIIGSGMIRLVNKNSRFCLLPLSLVIFLSAVFALFSLDTNFSFGADEKIALPSANAPSKSKSLPDLDDYVDWTWKARVFPYISLNSEDSRTFAKDGKINSVEFSTFSERDGKIKENVNTISFGQKFRAESISEIDSLNFPALEKMMKKQKHLDPGFVRSGSQNPGPVSITALVISMILPLAFYFYERPKSKAGKK